MGHQPGFGTASGFLVMWMAMMIPMMLPSLIPKLSHYRGSLRDARQGLGITLHGLTALAGVGYFAVWAAIGAAAYATVAAVDLLHISFSPGAPWAPPARGAALLLAGTMQLSGWKVTRLERCRLGPGCADASGTGALDALRHGLRLGLNCGSCCWALMLVMLAAGMTNMVVMAVVALVITAERLAPSPLRTARAAGMLLLAAGLVTTVTG